MQHCGFQARALSELALQVFKILWELNQRNLSWNTPKWEDVLLKKARAKLEVKLAKFVGAGGGASLNNPFLKRATQTHLSSKRLNPLVRDEMIYNCSFFIDLTCLNNHLDVVNIIKAPFEDNLSNIFW